MSAKKLLMMLAGAVLGTASLSVWAATQTQIDTARNKGLWWLFAHQNSEGRWGNSSIAAVAATASALEALNTAGLRGPVYARGYSWLVNAPASSVDSLARQLAAVRLAGGNTTNLERDLKNARNSLLGWGSYARYDTSFPDSALALSAILPSPLATYTTADAQEAVCRILEAVRADGGWSYSKAAFSGAANSSIIPTAYNMLALSAAQTTRGLTGCNTISIATTLNSSMAWLLTRKHNDNGFGAGLASDASSVIETAFAYRLLKQLNPSDPSIGPALDYLLGQQNSANGSWSGDDFLTALVLSQLPPPTAPLADTDKDGLPDAVEVLAGTDPLVANVHGILGNGQSVAGLTIPLELAKEAILGQSFSFTFSTPVGGTPPYTWSITTGSLPLGIGLAAGTGVLSGTPTTLGSFSFYYSVTDAALAKATTLGQISVYKSAPSLADGDINVDGVVDVADVVLAERIALGQLVPTLVQMQHADVSPVWYPDGVVDAADVARIRLKALGLQNW